MKGVLIFKVCLTEAILTNTKTIVEAKQESCLINQSISPPDDIFSLYRAWSRVVPETIVTKKLNMVRKNLTSSAGIEIWSLLTDVESCAKCQEAECIR